MARTVTDAIREALGGMTEQNHKDLADKGWTPADDKRKEYIPPGGGDPIPANKARDMERGNSKKKPVAQPN